MKILFPKRLLLHAYLMPVLTLAGAETEGKASPTGISGLLGSSAARWYLGSAVALAVLLLGVGWFLRRVVSHWAIQRRIAAGFIAVLASAAVLGVVTVLSLSSIRRSVEFLKADAIPGALGILRLDLSFDEAASLVEKHVYSPDKGGIDTRIRASRGEFDSRLEKFAASITKSEERLELDSLRKELARFDMACAKVLEASRKGATAEAQRLVESEIDPAELEVNRIIEGLVQLNESGAYDSAESALAVTDAGERAVHTAFAMAALLAISFGVLLSRDVARSLRAISETLAAGAEQTAAAAVQIAASSQSLAEGASEQAASLEETGASLEELNSMVRRNAESAARAKEIAGQTREAADTGTRDMAEMEVAMNDIRASSAEVAKIVKDIDEIAFQTNILALNAAVEAARAGEAGMGFAVVADEVRNLAQRSAKSAKETATKIEDALGKSQRGVLIANRATAGFAQIAGKTREVDQVVAEIAAASNEQSQGLQQVTSAISQMDQVTQSNASGAEQTASASEQLSSQAASVSQSVSELLRMVGVDKGSTTAPSPSSRHAAKQ